MIEPEAVEVEWEQIVPAHHHEGACDCEPTIAYVRVSKTTNREYIISPDIQFDAINAYAVRSNKRIVKIVTDINKTGRAFAKRKIEFAIKCLQGGLAKSITVWKLSRWGRNSAQSQLYLAQVMAVGGRVHSATEEHDDKTSSGRLGRDILLRIAEYNSDLISDSWRDSQDQRRKAQLPHSGLNRIGYIYVSRERLAQKKFHENSESCAYCIKEQPHYVVHDVVAEVIRQAYQSYLDGDSFYTIARKFNKLGLKTNTGGLWSEPGARQFLENGFAAGLIRERTKEQIDQQRAANKIKKFRMDHFEVWRKGIHTPIISEELWEDFKAERQRRSKVAPRVRNQRTGLSSLVRCAVCGRPMHATYANGYMNWRCLRGVTEHPDVPVYISDKIAMQAVRLWLQTLLKGVPATFNKEAQNIHQQRSRLKLNLSDTEREIEAANKAIAGLAQLVATGSLTTDQFEMAKRPFDRTLEELLRVKSENQSSSVRATTVTFDDLQAVDHLLDGASGPELGRALSTVVGLVGVEPGGRSKQPAALTLRRLRVIGAWEVELLESWTAARRAKFAK
jgi:site-specific DNA recombinase